MACHFKYYLVYNSIVYYAMFQIICQMEELHYIEVFNFPKLVQANKSVNLIGPYISLFDMFK